MDNLSKLRALRKKMGNAAFSKLEFMGHYVIECFGEDGKLKWKEEIFNKIPNAALTNILGVYYSGDTADTTRFIGLITGGSPAPSFAAGDTMSSHSGWTENTDYDESTRPAWSEAGAASQSITNSASPADFSINQNGTAIAGAFLAGDATKGGSAGLLESAGAFTGGDKSADAGDTLRVTLTITASSAT